MRATMSGYYRNLQLDHGKVAKELFDVTKQISSGQKIQYAYDDTSTFVTTMRLDNELTTLTQTQQNAQKALQFSTNTDYTMSEMTTLLDSMKTDLIYAASGVHSTESLNAIALELRGLEENFIQLANTSIDGRHLFSGTAINTKPIDGNGNYQGNDKDILAHLGSGVDQKYNVSGSDLFLGAENATHREITTNISLYDGTTGNYASVNSTLEDITGSVADQFFYIRGTNTDGSSFKEKIQLGSNVTVGSLLQAIGNAYTPSTGVSVTLDDRGAIVLTDKANSSSKLDFHMVAGNDVTDIDTLVPTTGLEFMKSGLTSNTVATGAESATYDRTLFTKTEAIIQSNVSQLVKNGVTDSLGNDIGNEFAVDSTKLTDVFSAMTGPLHIEGVDLTGAPFDIDINLNASPVTVTGDYAYTVADGNGNNTLPADITYRQLMDVVNMAINQQTPTDNNVGYRAAINNSTANSTIDLSYDGKITFSDLNNNPSTVDISMYDASSDTFPGAPGSAAGSIATFNTNNALSISDPKTDFFKQLDDLIKSVELGRINADGNGNDPRNLGIENAIQVIDDLSRHIGNQQAVVGTQSQTLQRTEERTQLLMLTTQTLRSETIDVDLAEAALSLQQLTLNYQAMLSTVSKVTQLSLVNFL